MYEGELNQMQRAYASQPDSGLRQVTIRKELELDAAQLEKQLAVKRELLQLLTDNPVIEKFMDLSRGIL